MRVLLMHKTDASNEAGIRPSAELIAGVGQMIREMNEAGVLLAGEGLRASSLGARVNVREGMRAITPGPLTGRNELPAAFCIMRVHSLAEASDWAARLAEALGEAEVDVRPVTEPWDLGMMPKPEGLTTTRYMAVLKADARTEAGEGPSLAARAALTALFAEMKLAGVFVSAERLHPSARSVRYRFSGGRSTVLDGPFAESKEMIAGFVMLRVNSLGDAMAWVPRYAAVLGDVELDVRPLYEAPY